MENVIYYFTGTGNSLMVAKEISKRLGNTRIISIAKAIKNEENMSKAHRIGFVFPVYYNGIPEVVERFIKQMNFKAEYVFVIATRGGAPAFAIKQLERLLKDKELELHYGQYLNMPASYVRVYDMKREEINCKIINKAKGKLNGISSSIEYKDINNVRSNIIYDSFANIIYKSWRKRLKYKDNNMYANEDCISCGICMKICPVSNISMVDSIPMWNHKCQDCMACIQYCPVKAIQAGNKTVKRKRYRNPEITLQEIKDYF